MRDEDKNAAIIIGIVVIVSLIFALLYSQNKSEEAQNRADDAQSALDDITSESE